MPYRSGGEEQHLTQEGSVVDDLVRQFADPYAFLRELVQNAIDAGARKIRVHMDRAQRGAAAWSVEDDGCGMTVELIEGPLLTAFASSKEGDSGKIGKYGVGFLSVFGMKPTLVRVITHRAEGAHEVRLYPDHSFEVEELPARPGHGTIVVVEHPVPPGGDAAHEDRGEAALVRWCRHAEVPIELDRPTTRGRATTRIDRPFALRAPVVIEVVEQGNRALVGVTAGTDRMAGAAGEAEYGGTGDLAGLYNRGLTLIEATSGDHVIAGVRYKLMGSALRHTLSRDDVKRDREHTRAMELVRHARTGALPAAVEAKLLAATVEASRSGDFAGHDALLAAAHATIPRFRIHVPLVAPDENTAASIDAERLAAAGTVLASRGATPAARELAKRGATVVRLPEDDAAATLLTKDLAVITGAPVLLVEEEATRLVHRTSTDLGAACDDLAAALVDALVAVGKAPAAVRFASTEFQPLSSLAVSILCEDVLPMVVLPEHLAERADRIPEYTKLVLLVGHPVVARAIRAADDDPRVAASMLARAVLLDRLAAADEAKSDALLALAAGVEA